MGGCESIVFVVALGLLGVVAVLVGAAAAV